MSVGPPAPLYGLICPYVSPATSGICQHSCSSDGDCTDGLKCCSNGCGSTCTTPDRVPYYSVPQECPSNQMTDTCDSPLDTCTGDSDCGANQLCCQRGGCGGRYCTHGVASTQPCFSVRRLFPTVTPPGAFIPACQDDGSFVSTQHLGSTDLSWCVDVQTGYPVSPFSSRGSTPQCNSKCQAELLLR